MEDREYAGFWIRTGASLIDSMLVLIITGPILTMIYGEYYWRADSFVVGGWNLLFTYVLPAIAVIAFWIYKSATPGKIATKLVIVDARTGGKPSSGQFIGRYLAYYVSIIPLCLGMLWIAFDRKKQGWHDKLAGTVVLRNYLPEPVPFEVEA
ncbi:RDD family protein [Marinobacter salicampi]|uniref:RDD family protein n=1 Tax=Marinobacter salicampi TaxID=435907 RepID=UPI00140B57E0|nr:RDD family protein [Marinobacter salicampi]